MLFSLDGQNRIILYDQKQILKFSKLVDPYIHVSMQRKILVFPRIKSIAKRTTIYLPTDIPLEKPTYDINHVLYDLASLNELRIEEIISKKSTFERNNLKRAYQIMIASEHHGKINTLRMKTGLPVSQIIEVCFRNKKKTRIE